MNRIFLIIFVGHCLLGTICAAGPTDAQKSGDLNRALAVPDPRFVVHPVLLYRNRKDEKTGLGDDTLLIFARRDDHPLNHILGVDGSFTNEQIIAALTKFFREWRPPGAHPDYPRPDVIVAYQDWGGGAGLHEPLKQLSAEYKIDVYLFFTSTNEIQSDTSKHPTPNDKRLGEILNEKRNP